MENLNLRLYDAVAEGRIRAIENLLDRGANPDAVVQVSTRYSTTSRLESLLFHRNNPGYQAIINRPISTMEARRTLDLLKVHPNVSAQNLFEIYFWLLRNGLRSDPRFEERIIADYVCE